jgi:predicted nuclease of predicted toxin-antitoxin system
VPPRILLLIDECVPDAVGAFLRARGHDVRLVRELFPGGIADPVIATVGDSLSAIVVTWDRDFESLARRVPEGNRQRFRRLGRLSFRCREPRGRALIEKWIDSIEFEYERAERTGDRRMIVQISESGIRIS